MNKKIFLITTGLLLFGFHTASAQRTPLLTNHAVTYAKESGAPDLIPQPVSLTLNDGLFLLQGSTALYIDPSIRSLAADAAAYLQQTVQPSSHIALIESKKALNQDVICFAPLSSGTSLPAEGYALTVTPEAITVAAGDAAGFFYGVQTLLQLLPAQVYRPLFNTPQHLEQLNWNVPCVRIEDYPRFAFRGMMLDVSRQFYTVAFVKQYIDWMAKHKLNRFHWHLADDNGWRIEIKKYPLLTQKGAWRGPGEALAGTYGHDGERYGGFYTQADIKDIVAYAAKRHVEIIPEIDLPGHSKAVAESYPEIVCKVEGEGGFSVQGLSNNVWCVSREENYVMLEQIIKEMVTLFPSKYFHVGGDEVAAEQWASCPECRALMERENMDEPAALEHYFVMRMQKILNKFGKTLIGWDDIIEDGELDKEHTVVLAWRSIKQLKNATSRGYQAIALPAQNYYLDMKHTAAERGMAWASITEVEKVYALDPIAAAGLTPEESKLVIGMQGALWSELLDRPEYIAEYQTYPRLSALAEAAWTPQKSRNWEDFNTRLSRTHFDRLYYMGISFRIPPVEAGFVNGYICADTQYPWMAIRYTTDNTEPGPQDALYTGPIKTDTPEGYRFATFYRDGIRSAVTQVTLPYSRFQSPKTTVTSNLKQAGRNASLEPLSDYQFGSSATFMGPFEEGQFVLFTFEQPVSSPLIQVSTGIPGLEIDNLAMAHVEYSTDGKTFVRADAPWQFGGCCFIPQGPVKAVKICVDAGNQILRTYFQDIKIYK